MAISTASLAQKNKIYRFPENLVDGDRDESGKPVQFVLFEIAAPGVGTPNIPFTDIPLASSKLGGGDSFETPAASTDDGAQSFADELDNKPSWRMANKLGVLDIAIALPMPAQHNVSTSVNYNTQYTPSDLQKAGDAYKNGGAAGLGADGVTATLANLGSTAGSFAGGVIAGILNKMIGGKMTGDITSDQFLATQGIAVNPRNEVMFDGIKFRTFDFRYRFAPKSAAESAQLQTIIRKFRYYALPTLSPTKIYYTFPGVFKIQFFWGNTPNTWIPRIGTCVLNSVAVDYSPDGIWATMPMGDPVQIGLALNFTEIELVDSHRVDDSGITSDGVLSKKSGY